MHGIVKQSGGEIVVETTPGMGSAFHAFLPAVPAGARPEARSEARAVRAGHARGGETVLLVEDDDAVRRLLRRTLEGDGYRVLEATDGREAMEVARQHAGSIDLLISDLVMPEIPGPDLAARLVQRRSDLRVLLMSGYTPDAAAREGLPVIEGVLLKPFPPRLLSQRVRELLDAPAGASG